jgi:proteasome lid subunit RPN8/RPN11
MIVAIASGVAETLVKAAATAAPYEACGLLIGRPGRIESTVPARNVAARPETAFEIDPATLLRTHREVRATGQHVVGHYHSHSNGIAAPSSRDAARAVEDGQLWLIIAGSQVCAFHSVGEGTQGALHGRFLPAELVAG